MWRAVLIVTMKNTWIGHLSMAIKIAAIVSSFHGAGKQIENRPGLLAQAGFT